MDARTVIAGLRTSRVIFLAVAFGCAILAAVGLSWPMNRPVYEQVAILDITRSMNVRDYTVDGRPLSRLEFVKLAMRQALAGLPCGSRLGLGLFTERRAALLFRPIEVCRGYEVLISAIDHVDWRMAWAADSRIVDGLYDSLATLQDLDADLIFLTDGHEAPPRNPRYRPPLVQLKNKVRGVLVGVGGLALSPIPKFNEKGEPAGFYTAEEVPHRSRFGLPNKHPTEIEGYDARNAPFGSEWEIGTEHLSSLKEPELQELAKETGLGYRRLEYADDLRRAMTAEPFARRRDVAADLSWAPSGLALACLVLVYLAEGFGWPLRSGRWPRFFSTKEIRSS